MILEKGNMWSVFFDTSIFMITTNPVIRSDNAVVMGRGIAAEAKQRYPELPYTFARQLRAEKRNVGLIDSYEETPIWYFMVKSHWQYSASLDIIRQSVHELMNSAALLVRRIDLNFPGIGNGRLSKEAVLPLLMKLPDNVHIWEKE